MPVTYGHRDVLLRGYVDEVVISRVSEIIARHPCSYQQGAFVYDPIHYLPLLERKPGALPQAAPLQGWDLPEELAPPCAGYCGPAWAGGASGSSSRRSGC